jgi:hypothetical protein
VPAINYGCRHFQRSLISHFPCRWDCEGSLAVAEGVLQALRRHDPGLAEDTLACLDTDVLYATEVVVAVQGARWREGTLRPGEARAWTVGLEGAQELRLEGDRVALVGGGRERSLTQFRWLPFHSQQPLPAAPDGSRT